MQYLLHLRSYFHIVRKISKLSITVSSHSFWDSQKTLFLQLWTCPVLSKLNSICRKYKFLFNNKNIAAEDMKCRSEGRVKVLQHIAHIEQCLCAPTK